MSEVEPLWRRIVPKAGWIAGPDALPLVSVVVTAYNYERFIPACLKSVAAQSYTNLECIVVDDCSADGTFESAERTIGDLDRARFKVVRNGVNVGQLASQSIGFMQCRGSFVTFLDADDLLAPTFVERHLFAQLNGDYPTGLSVSDQITIDDHGSIHSGTRVNRDALAELTTARNMTISAAGNYPSMKGMFLPWDDDRTHQTQGWYWQTQSAMMFRRSVLDLIVPPPDDCGAFRICADFYLARFAHLIASSMILFEPLGAYRQHEANNFSGSAFMSTDQQGGDVQRLPSYSSYTELVRTTIRRRQDHFNARLGHFRLAQIDGMLGDHAGERRSGGTANRSTVLQWLSSATRR